MKKADKIINAIVSGNIKILELATKTEAYTIEQWSRTPDGLFTRANDQKKVTEEAFDTYYQLRRDDNRFLFFLSAENLTDQQLIKYGSHDTTTA